MSILILNDREPLPAGLLKEINQPYQLYETRPEDFDLDEAIARHPDTRILVATYQNLTANVLRQLPKLSAIVLTTTAYEYVDLDYCQTHGIPVMNNKGYSQTAVAEHLMALMFATARRIPRLDQQLRAGDFAQFDQPGFEFAGKRLGIIGMGHIGQTFARLCSGLGMEICFYNRSDKDSPFPQLSLDELLATADVLALTLAMNPDSAGLINAHRLGQMKRGGLLVSIAADAIIDQPALIQSLESGQLAGAGLDLHHPQPALYAFPQVVLTPTKAWYTEECMHRRTESWIQTLNQYLVGEITPEKIVNKGQGLALVTSS